MHALVDRSLEERRFTEKSVRRWSSAAKKLRAVTFQIGIHSADVAEVDVKTKGRLEQKLRVLASQGWRREKVAPCQETKVSRPEWGQQRLQVRLGRRHGK